MYSKEETPFVFDPVDQRWIPFWRMDSQPLPQNVRLKYMTRTFQSIAIKLLEKIQAYDRECEQLKCLQTIARAVEHFQGVEQLLNFAKNVVELVKEDDKKSSK